MRFQLVPKSTTLGDPEGLLCTLLHKKCFFRSATYIYSIIFISNQYLLSQNLHFWSSDLNHAHKWYSPHIVLILTQFYRLESSLMSKYIRTIKDVISVIVVTLYHTDFLKTQHARQTHCQQQRESFHHVSQSGSLHSTTACSQTALALAVVT